MKLFVSGFILLMLVSSTLGDTPPMPLQEDVNLLPAQDACHLQENAQGGRPHNNIGCHFGSCRCQYVNCLLNTPVTISVSLSDTTVLRM